MMVQEVTDARIKQIRDTMYDQRLALLRMIAEDPDDFDAREQLWMDREDLRHELDGLLQFKPTFAERVSFTLFGRYPMPTVGASFIVICLFS